MFTIEFAIPLKIQIVFLAIHPNGFAIGRIGKPPIIEWTLFSFFYARFEKRFHMQFFSKRDLLHKKEK